MRTVLWLTVCALMVFCGCNKSPNFKGNDLLMVQKAAVVKEAINNYRNANLEFPEDMNWARQFVPMGESWPDNPYNGQPITDTKSPDFDPATSVGNVYYQVFVRNEMAVGFQLHVYGEKDKLWIYGNTALGVKE